MNATPLKDPDALVTTEWLEHNLHDPSLRLFDCSTILSFENTDGKPYRVVNCAGEHEDGHIPGAQFLDLQADFSRQDSPFAMTLAEPNAVAAAFARSGVSDQSRVVLYSRKSMSWSTRFWWMLRWIGFDRAAILDGGYDKWLAEGRPVSMTKSSYPKGKLTMNVRPELFVGKAETLAAIEDPSICTLSALGRDIHSGENQRYGRPGRIRCSKNVPQIELTDPDTLAFKAASEIAEIFASVGADMYTAHINYCGGGIFATVNAFWLYQLGYEYVSVYDNSMSEWATDESLPMETD